MLVEIAEARSLPATEGVIGDRNRDRHIDTDHADLHAAGEIAGSITVTGEDRNAVAIFMIVRQSQRFLVVLGAHDRENRTEDFFLVDAHVFGHVVEQATTHVEAIFIALHLEVTAIDDQLRAFFNTKVHITAHAVERSLGDQRAVIGGIVGGGADLQRFNTGNELFHQTVGGVFTDRNGNRDRHAAFASRTVASADQRIDGLVHVGIRHDEEMVLRTAEALHALAVRAAAAIDVLGNRRGADKADGLDVRIVEQRIDRFLVAVDDVENACRKTGFHEQFGKAHRYARITFGWFQDEGISASNRRTGLPERDHGRKVEWRDASNNAERLAHGVSVDARTGIVGELALEHVRRTEADFHHFEAALDVALGVGNGLAMFAGQQFGQAVIFGFDQFDELAQDANATLRVGRSPGWLCSLGVFDSRAHFFLGGERYLALHRAVERLEDVCRAATLACHMLAADEMSDIAHRRTSLMIALRSLQSSHR